MTESWTAKGPALIVGAIVFLVGLGAMLYGKSKPAFLAGLFCLILGVFTLVYSMKIKDWCVHTNGSAFSSEFHQSFGQCLRLKGWLEF